jgi:zinc transporter ZupT
MIILLGIATFASTLLGGLFTLRFKDRSHLILGFSAGAVIGAAFFDLLPESIALGGAAFSPSVITSVVALGFAVYMVLDRLIVLHGGSEDAVRRGALGAGSLLIHSFFDGVTIGLALQVSVVTGAVVAVAVLMHDFSDGINTVSVVLKHGGSRMRAFHWLLVDALAPVAGIVSTLFFTLSEGALSLLLAIFCGFFLYIGASDLLPESQHQHSTLWTTIATLCGMSVLFVAMRLAGA